MTKLDPISIGLEIRKLRNYRDLTRNAMASMLAIHLNTYSKIENGNFNKLDIGLLNQISDILEVPVVQLLIPVDARSSSNGHINSKVDLRNGIDTLIGGLNQAKDEGYKLTNGSQELRNEIENITPLISDIVRAAIYHTIRLKRDEEKNNVESQNGIN